MAFLWKIKQRLCTMLKNAVNFLIAKYKKRISQGVFYMHSHMGNSGSLKVQ